MIIIKLSPEQYLSMQKHLEEASSVGKNDMAKEAMRKAIRETAKGLKEKLYAETKKEYTIKRFKKSSIRVLNPTKRLLRAILEVEGEPLGLRGSYKNRKNGKRKGASAMVKAGGQVRELILSSGGRGYKAFVTTVKNVAKDGTVSEHTGIFQRVPGKKMRAHPEKEAIRQLYGPARSKAAESTYREKLEPGMQSELSYHLHRHINEVVYGRR